jgi:hypothetical protein
MKIIYTKVGRTGCAVEKIKEGKCLVDFLHYDSVLEFSEEVLQPFVVYNTLYEAILRRKGEWK